MRWRVGRSLTSRSNVTTSCHGHPLRLSVGASRSAEASAETWLKVIWGRNSMAHFTFLRAIVSFANISPARTCCKRFATTGFAATCKAGSASQIRRSFHQAVSRSGREFSGPHLAGRPRRFARPLAYVRECSHMKPAQTAARTVQDMENRRSSFEFEDLLACGRGELFAGGPQLPLPPMLMFDRISEISEQGGEHGRGLARAELDVKPDLWFFPCHFKGDPVMPGCLGLDALWQLVGFFLGWAGAEGNGRALGMGEVKFSGQVLPTVKKVVYGIDVKRVMRSKLVLGIADGWLAADGEVIYKALDLKVGLFRQGAAIAPGGA